LEQGGGYVIPNPFIPGLGQRARFVFRLTTPGASFAVRVVNIKGRLVRTLRNEYDWDGRDDSGRDCEGGLYIYQLEAEGKHMSGTVVLIER